MAVLATLKKDRLGAWATLADYLADLRRRETGAVAALASALSALPDERRELGRDGMSILIEVASDLRLPKCARLAAARCVLEAGASGQPLGALFLGAGDLATDPRLGSAAKRLVEDGLPAALAAPGTRAISLEAGAFARGAQAAASVLGTARVKETLAAAGEGHAGVAAGLFALGAAPLPEVQRAAWVKLLERTCAANRSAPAAAKRLGLAPSWPPNLPDAFAPLAQEAEKATAGVVAADAAAGTLKPGPSTPPRFAPPGPLPAPPPLPPAPQPRSGIVEVGRKTVAPIKRSPFRRPIGIVVEGPTALPPKPMPPVTGRAPLDAVASKPAAATGHPARSGPLPGMAPLLKHEDPIRFDARGKRIPRPDRWKESDFQWEAPILPPVLEPAPLRKASAALGPFARRLAALFEDRPEGVERLCAAVEARAALHGLATAIDELSRELSHPRWKGRRLPPAQLERLAGSRGEAHPESWNAAATLLLARLRIESR
jgi:hypothetical protein